MKFPKKLFFAACMCVFSGLFFMASAKEKAYIENIPIPQTFPEGESQLAIPIMQQTQIVGSDLVIEEVLPKGENYHRYIVSYYSQGFKIYSLLTIPEGKVPEDGFPAIVFAHGYVPPKEYSSGYHYSEYVDALAKNGYAVLKPDFRGHGSTQGVAEGAYFSSAYTIDYLHAIASLKLHKDINSSKIGLWGHSMGGHIILRTAAIGYPVKSAVIWSGVVGSYEDLLYNWSVNKSWEGTQVISGAITPVYLSKMYGSMTENPEYWSMIDPFQFVPNVSIPLQLHHGVRDSTVPVGFSQKLYNELQNSEKSVEYYEYDYAEHEFTSDDFDTAIERTLQFFKTTLQ